MNFLFSMITNFSLSLFCSLAHLLLFIDSFLHKYIDIEMRFDLRSTDIWTISSFFSLSLYDVRLCLRTNEEEKKNKEFIQLDVDVARELQLCLLFLRCSTSHSNQPNDNHFLTLFLFFPSLRWNNKIDLIDEYYRCECLRKLIIIIIIDVIFCF